MDRAQRASRRPTAGRAEMIGRSAIGVLLAVTVFVVAISLTSQPVRPQPAAWSEVTVEAGSSLWDLAQRHPVAGLSTPETVELIVRSNDMDAAMVAAGQVIRVPASAAPGVAVALR